MGHKNEFSHKIETFDVEEKIPSYPYPGYIDLSNDILINRIAEQTGRPKNPNAEFVNVNTRFNPIDLSRDTYINEIAELNGRRPHPDAEIFHRPIPISENLLDVDLSRDTYVNEIAHRNHMPLNLDAEYIDNHPKGFYYYKTENS